MTDPNLGARCYVMIDPSWEHRFLWRSPQGTRLNFTYVDFENGIDEAAQPNYGDTDITGRAEPYKAFLGNTSKEIQLSLNFVSQTGDLQSEVVNPGRFLDSLKYGLFDPGTELTTEAPPCLLKVGTLFFGRVVLTNGDPKWIGPIDTETLLPHQCQFEATFSVVRQFQADLSYRYNGQWT
jgi:hypothetical protein